MAASDGASSVVVEAASTWCISSVQCCGMFHAITYPPNPSVAAHLLASLRSFLCFLVLGGLAFLPVLFKRCVLDFSVPWSLG